MVVCFYIFDVIIESINLVKPDMSKKKFSADIRFHNSTLHISSSRIGVQQFVEGRSFEIEANPKTLRQNLECHGFGIVLKCYDNSIGTGRLRLPECLLNKLSVPTFTVSHQDKVDILNTFGELVATMEVNIKLENHCPGLTDGQDTCSTKPRCGDLCVIRKKHIDPKDKLFLFSNQTKSMDCQSAKPSFTIKDISSCVCSSETGTDQPPPCPLCNDNPIPPKYQQLIDAVGPKVNHPPCGRCRKSIGMGVNADKYKDPDWTFPPMPVAVCNPLLEGQPNLLQQDFELPRHCPVCRENIAWLPKLAACPNCGYKAVPMFDEKPYDEELQAIDILKGYDHDAPPDENYMEAAKSSIIDVEEKKGKCNCDGTNNCTRCRIRKICQDIFKSTESKKTKNGEPICKKTEEVESKPVGDGSATSQQDVRPYLARIFEEMRNQYDIKNNEIPNIDLDAELEKCCELQKSAEGRVCPRKRRYIKRIKRKNTERKIVKKRKSKIRKCNYISRRYSLSRIHPRFSGRIGHKTCLNVCSHSRRNVPYNMGWLWNRSKLGTLRGWKPGAISKRIKVLMRYFLKDYPADTLRVSQYCFRKQLKPKEATPVLRQKPTLHIVKKDFEYIITLRPLKDAGVLQESADPYVDMEPIQFRIVKNPVVTEQRKLKRYLKDLGFAKCICHRPVNECYCRSFCDKKRLEYELAKECENRRLENCMDNLVLSDTTDSDAEFDFGVTPPAGVIKPDRLVKPDCVHIGTQYQLSDWQTKPFISHHPNPFESSFACAVRERPVVIPKVPKAKPKGKGKGKGKKK